MDDAGADGMAASAPNYYLIALQAIKTPARALKRPKITKTPQNLLRRLLQRPHLRIAPIGCQQLGGRNWTARV
jgi:hypothetical protein